MGRMAERAWRDIWRMESARAFAPLREGGAARRKMVYGLRVRSGRKGRRGEYCGWPSMHAFAWSSAERLILLLALGRRDCRDGRPQYSPRRGPCRLSFAMHPPSIHGRATPLSEGGVSCRPPCALHSWDSRGGSTRRILGGPGFVRAVSTGRFGDMPETPRSRGRDKARPSPWRAQRERGRTVRYCPGTESSQSLGRPQMRPQSVRSPSGLPRTVTRSRPVLRKALSPMPSRFLGSTSSRRARQL